MLSLFQATREDLKATLATRDHLLATAEADLKLAIGRLP
jgi:hypothetical protein